VGLDALVFVVGGFEEGRGGVPEEEEEEEEEEEGPWGERRSREGVCQRRKGLETRVKKRRKAVKESGR